ncbi:MAG TPA: PKD domain-containing protein, partial [Solirubrobacteraceae bacterium]|nr:PKD domain-containing protein [Solirubrobacteraceae bacterium]
VSSIARLIPLIGVVTLAFAGTLAARAQPVWAVILPAVTIDGPSQEIVGFGGVAMAEDGTGGLVYLRRVGGVPHVFVSRFVEGHWLAPIRVDSEEPFAASWPRIGAAEGGELVVVWATPFGTERGHPEDELLGATLGPGASSFGRAALIDPDIGDGAGASPDLAMSSTGQADVVYRVVESEAGKPTTIPLLRPGDVVEEVRVAHYEGDSWSSLGEINRDVGLSMRPPTQANAPQIAIGPAGNGLVVWQEPEIEGVARIWGRRIFGASLDYVLPVSATSFNGNPIVADADAPSVASSRLGLAEVAYRQLWSPGSPLPGPRIFLNVLPDGEASSGGEFAGATVLDESAVAGEASATVGPPSIDIDEQQGMRLLYDSNGTPRVIEGDDRGLSGAVSLGPAVSGGEDGASVMNPAGGGVSAWASAGPQGPAVAVREDFADGAAQTALVEGGGGGPVSELAVGRSGLGDGLIGFLQGPIGNAAIVADQVSAPPQHFVVNVPHRWVKPSHALVSWQAAPSANGPLSYSTVVDGGAPQPVPAGALESRIDAQTLGSGAHHVQVLATDSDGASMLSSPLTLLVDGQPPTVKITPTSGGAGVQVRASDAYSGLDAKAVSVTFGDGASARGHARLRHRYARGGIYRVSVHVRSNIGNEGVFSQLVKVR